MNLQAGLLVGLAIALITLVVAYWPRAVAFVGRLRHGAGAIPAGVTPFVATLLSGPGQMDLLTCGLMWIIARPRPAAPADGSAALSRAEADLRDSLVAEDSLIDDPREVAATVLAAHNPAPFEVGTVLNSLRECTQEDARSLGLLRDSRLISRILAAVAGFVLLVAFLLADAATSVAWLIAGALAMWAALHVDPRSFAGAMTSGGLRRLRDHLRAAALVTESIDSDAIRSLVPAGATAAETEVWVVSTGCRTAGSEKVAKRLRSIDRLDIDRPRRIRYTQWLVVTGGQVTGYLKAPFRNAWRRLQPPQSRPSGAPPVIW